MISAALSFVINTVSTVCQSLIQSVFIQMRPSTEIPGEQQISRPVTEKKGSRSSDLQLEQLIIAMALNNIKEMKETVDADCKAFKKEVQEIRNHLKNATEVSEALESELSYSFKRLKKMFFFDDRPRSNASLPAIIRTTEDARASKLERNVMAMWEAREEDRKVPIIVDLLRMIRRELGDLGKKAKEKTDEMVKELAQLKSDAHFHHLSLKSKNEGLDRQFLEIAELIQGCCTIKKIPLSTLEGCSA